MILKALLVIGVIAVVYFMFIKKKASTVAGKTTKKETREANEMVECVSCGVYIEINEAILSSTKYYCSNECINKEA